jgi:hypothetical protein
MEENMIILVKKKKQRQMEVIEVPPDKALRIIASQISAISFGKL